MGGHFCALMTVLAIFNGAMGADRSMNARSDTSDMSGREKVIDVTLPSNLSELDIHIRRNGTTEAPFNEFGTDPQNPRSNTGDLSGRGIFDATLPSNLTTMQDTRVHNGTTAPILEVQEWNATGTSEPSSATPYSPVPSENDTRQRLKVNKATEGTELSGRANETTTTGRTNAPHGGPTGGTQAPDGGKTDREGIKGNKPGSGAGSARFSFMAMGTVVMAVICRVF